MEGFPARLYDERGQKLSQQNIYLKLSRASYFSFCWPALLLMSVASTDCSVTLQSNWMQVSLLLKINKNIGSIKKYSTTLTSIMKMSEHIKRNVANSLNYCLTEWIFSNPHQNFNQKLMNCCNMHVSFF